MAQAVEYIHDLAEQIGDHDRQTTTSVGTTSTLVCSTYANSVLSPSEFANFSVLIESGACLGEQGMLTNSGLTTASGTLTTADTFTSAIASGVAFSIYDRNRLPPYREGKRPGLLEVINQALRYLWIESTITLTGVSGQERYGIEVSSYPWFTTEDKIIEVRYPVSDSDDRAAVVNYSDWSWEANGETRQLVMHGAPFATGESIAVKVYRPANSRLRKNAHGRAALSTTTVGSIAVVHGGYYTSAPTVTISGGGGSGAAATAVLATTPGPVTSFTVTNAGTGYTSVPTVTVAAGAWADQTSQTAGLESITDEAISDVLDVTMVSMWRAYLALASLTKPGQQAAEWLGKAEMARGAAMGLEHWGEPSNRRSRVAQIRPVLVGRGYGTPSVGRRSY